MFRFRQTVAARVAVMCLLLLAALAFGARDGVTAAAAVSFPDAADQLPRSDDATGAQTGVPDYELDTFKGTKLRLSALRGRVVLLDFFSATCPHCQKHAPFVADLAKRYRERGLVVVNLAANNQFVDGDKVAEYVRNAGVENEVVWAPAELFKLYLAPNRDGQIGVPYSILFGADGRAVARFDRFEDADKPAIEQAVQKAVTGNK